MKSKFTLTKTLALVMLLVSFTAVSAASIEDDSCKTKCCKTKKTKTISVSLAELDKALEDLDTEIKYVTAVAISKEIKKSLRTVRLKKIAVTPETPAVFFAFDGTEQESKVDEKQKIDFKALDKEMNQVQEDLSRMDSGLKCDDAKNRKAAEEILKTGIKS